MEGWQDGWCILERIQLPRKGCACEAVDVNQLEAKKKKKKKTLAQRRISPQLQGCLSIWIGISGISETAIITKGDYS